MRCRHTRCALVTGFQTCARPIYDCTVTVNPTVTPPTVDVDLVGDKACIKEDGSVTFDIVVSAAGGTDDVVNTATFDQFAELQAAGWTVTISDNGADGTLAGFGYAGGTEQTVTFTITLAPPADSDLDVASTLAGLDLAVSATARDGALVSDPTGPIAIDVNVDAVADAVTVSIAVQDGDDANSSFAIGETGKITVQATFGDFIDGSETHTVTITAPEGFTIGDVVGSLPTGVSIQSASRSEEQTSELQSLMRH